MLNTKTLPANLLDALHKRGHADEQIAEMTPSEAFEEFCNWHGLSGWGSELWSLMCKLQNEVTSEMIEAAEGVEDLYKRGTPDTWATVYRAMRGAAQA